MGKELTWADREAVFRQQESARSYEAARGYMEKARRAEGPNHKRLLLQAATLWQELGARVSASARSVL